jgi:hypothetical protein
MFNLEARTQPHGRLARQQRKAAREGEYTLDVDVWSPA